MALKDENILGLVENISKFLNTILFTGLGIKIEDYEDFEEMVEFKLDLKKDIEAKNFKKAQEKLFKEIEEKNKSNDILRVGCWFFLKLNSLDEEILKEGDFSKRDVLAIIVAGFGKSLCYYVFVILKSFV